MVAAVFMSSVDILACKKYSYTYEEGRIVLTKKGVAYTYGDGVWKDKLTAVGDKTISYDAQGNPVTYLGHTLTWEKGRQLKSFDNNSYTYNANGIRTSKTVNGVKHTYTLDGTKILRETWGNNVLVPLYDNEDSVCGILYNGTPYYFERNLQGDVTGIFTRSGATLVLYSYDAWGVCTIVSDSSDCGIGNINPFRYRGYYYDAEIGMYYLQSRYYDPGVGRFINGDMPKMVSLVAMPTLHNLFSYCQNNSVNYSDSFGYLAWPGEIHRYVQNILAVYIWLFLNCFTYVDYFIRFSAFNYGFADLYAKSWKEIWEVKPNKSKYRTSGPKQLKKYLDGIKGSKKGRNLGNFTTYYYSSGFYKVKIYSNSKDGMIYYDYEYCWKVNATILLAVTSIVLIASGAGASVGAPALAGLLAIA